MIDALLFAVLDTLRSPQLGYGVKTCDIRPDGHPVPRCGDVFVAVHEGASRSTNDNCLMEWLAFSLTLTMKVNISPDRIGDQLLARRLAKEIGFNRRAEVLRANFHMAWDVLAKANQNLVTLADPDTATVYGFCEPARYRGMDVPHLVGPEWFDAEEAGENIGLTSELRFEDARRMQPIGLYQ